MLYVRVIIESNEARLPSTRAHRRPDGAFALDLHLWTSDHRACFWPGHVNRRAVPNSAVKTGSTQSRTHGAAERGRVRLGRSRPAAERGISGLIRGVGAATMPSTSSRVLIEKGVKATIVCARRPRRRSRFCQHFLRARVLRLWRKVGRGERRRTGRGRLKAASG